MNSLVAVELRSWFTKEMGSKVAAFDTKGLAGAVASKNTLVNGEANSGGALHE